MLQLYKRQWEGVSYTLTTNDTLNNTIGHTSNKTTNEGVNHGPLKTKSTTTGPTTGAFTSSYPWPSASSYTSHNQLPSYLPTEPWVPPKPDLNNFKPKSERSKPKGPGENPNARRYPNNITDILSSWFKAHKQHPYPTTKEKLELMRETELSRFQIRQWFTNARRRSGIKERSPQEAKDPPPTLVFEQLDMGPRSGE